MKNLKITEDLRATTENSLFYWVDRKDRDGLTLGMSYNVIYPIPMLFTDSIMLHDTPKPYAEITSAIELLAEHLNLARKDDGRIFHINGYPRQLAQRQIDNGTLPRQRPLSVSEQGKLWRFLGRNVARLAA